MKDELSCAGREDQRGQELLLANAFFLVKQLLQVVFAVIASWWNQNGLGKSVMQLFAVNVLQSSNYN